MAPVPSRLAAPIPSRYPPPRFAALAPLALVAMFAGGIVCGAGVILSLPPPTVERCISAPDPIACIITLDDAAMEPPL
jgi:hypothetical protein